MPVAAEEKKFRRVIFIFVVSRANQRRISAARRNFVDTFEINRRTVVLTLFAEVDSEFSTGCREVRTGCTPCRFYQSIQELCSRQNQPWQIP